MKDLRDVSMRSDFDCYLFGEGKHYEIYRRMGAHAAKDGEKEGVCFSVWAPHARRVSVIGTFNGWDEDADVMEPLGSSGVYERFIPGVIEGDLYKFCIESWDGSRRYKADPYAAAYELRPGTASRVADISGYEWTDESWCRKRSQTKTDTAPMSIYEVHPGSFQRRNHKEGEDGFLNYRQQAHALADYVLEMGYTHVELMGICEHPFDGSWGYQVTGYFAPTSRFGSPKDFMYFVNYMHRRGIGVILDWVPAHFPKDDHGLALFDGGYVYEYEDPRKGEHPDWGTKVFDFEKCQVRNFLIASALCWLQEYHVDGLRVDAVSSMLYLDYGRAEGQWIPNIYGGNQNLEAVSFLQELNSVVKERAPGCCMIAEESTPWKMVTGPVKDGGLGFDFKWNMGWMNDTLFYYQKDPVYRQYHHDNMTFGMVYAYDEKFILPYSHDEVVHGKGSLIEKMPGDGAEKFAGLRAAYAFMFGHPGKKLLFMGQEFAQEREWSEARALDWELLSEEPHRKMRHYVQSLLWFYRDNPELYQADCSPEGFAWVEKDRKEESIITFVRYAQKKEHGLFFVFNFTPVDRRECVLKTISPLEHRLVLDSEWGEFGGSSPWKPESYRTAPCADGEKGWEITFNLSGLSAAVFRF